jgi:3-oxoacyl-[acyl-carrier protein] reductase
VAEFTGRTALVTGGGRGIGRAIALELASRGASVVLLARSRDQLQESAALIQAQGASATVIEADLGDELQLARVIAELGRQAPPIDILVNNAGVVWPLGPTLGVDRDERNAAFTINVDAPITLSVALAPGMIERGWGRIVNISSGVVARPHFMPSNNTYVATKAALEAHTLGFASELAGTGVTVNAYRPGMVDTGMQDWLRAQGPNGIDPGMLSTFVSAFEEGRLLTPAHTAASLIDHVSSDETGQIWVVTAPPTA